MLYVFTIKKIIIFVNMPRKPPAPKNFRVKSPEIGYRDTYKNFHEEISCLRMFVKSEELPSDYCRRN